MTEAFEGTRRQLVRPRVDGFWRGPSERLHAPARLAVAVLMLSLATGCAQLGSLGGAEGPAAAAREPVPTEGPPEFHVLVAQELEGEGRLAEALAAYQRALAGDPEAAFLHRQIAELAARQNDLDLALKHAEQALVKEPEDEGVRLFLGTLYRFRRDVASAERVLRDGDGQPTSARSAALLYGLLSEASRKADAREVALWLVEASPEEVRSFLSLADAENKLGHAAEAEAVLRRGLIQHPDELALFGALARGRRERGDREGEVAIYREVLGTRSGHHATLLAKADAELALGRNDDARSSLEAIEREHPRDLRTLLRLGFLDFEQSDFAAATMRFRRALALQPKQQEVAYFLAISLRREGDLTEAREIFQRVEPEHPRYAEARTQLASMAEKEGDIAQAIGYVEQAQQVAPSRPLDLYLGTLRAKSGDVAGALVFLESLLDASGDDADVLYNIGVIHGEARNVDEAIRTMRAVLGMNPDHAGALNYVGYTWAERGENLLEAEVFIERALEQRPGDGFITDSLGWIYYMRARPMVESGAIEAAQELIERAKQELERAAELTGGDPVISEHLGDVFLLQGDRRRALELYEEAWQAGPREAEQPQLGEKLERLRQELGHR